MKILQINSVCGVGSTGRIAVELAKQQTTLGFEAAIVYGRGTAPVIDGVTTIKVGRSRFNVLEHVFEARLFDNGGFASRRATKRLIEEIEAFNPEVVHLHNLHGYYLNVGLLFDYLASSQRQVILTLHDCWPFSPQSAYLELDQAGKVPTRVVDKSEFKEYPETFYHAGAKRLYRRKKAAFTKLAPSKLKIMTPSDWLTNLANQSFLRKYEIQTIHNGIDLTQFKPTEQNYLATKYQLAGKKIILGAANIWEPRKGLMYFDALAEQLPDNYQVIVVGRQNETLKSAKIIKIQQTDDVAELAKLYAAADIFVNPTLADNFPTTNIESLASGTPVVTFKTGGSPESLTPQVGRVVPIGDTDGLLAACQSLEKTPAVQAACVERAQQFDKQKTYQKYLDCYQTFK